MRLFLRVVVSRRARRVASARQYGRVETFKRTPLQLFNLPQHFVIPLTTASSSTRRLRDVHAQFQNGEVPSAH